MKCHYIISMCLLVSHFSFAQSKCFNDTHIYKKVVNILLTEKICDDGDCFDLKKEKEIFFYEKPLVLLIDDILYWGISVRKEGPLPSWAGSDETLNILRDTTLTVKSIKAYKKALKKCTVTMVEDFKESIPNFQVTLSKICFHNETEAMLTAAVHGKERISWVIVFYLKKGEPVLWETTPWTIGF